MKIRISFLLVLCGLLVSCGNKSEYKLTELKKESFTKLVNSYNSSKGGDLETDKVLFNNDSKLSVSLYDDGKFYYDIVGVGTGYGTWTQEEYSMKLVADTGLFGMELNIKTKDNQTFEFHYLDRFGYNVVNANVKNFVISE